MSGEMEMQGLGDRIKFLRKERNLTQVDLAKKLKVTQSTISKWEKEEVVPDLYNLEMMARVFKIERESLTGFLKPDEDGRRVAIVGKLAAGVFEETLELPVDEQRTPAVFLGSDLDGVPVQGFIVKGDSMNSFYPDGSIVYVAMLRAIPGAPQNGHHVMVMRRNSDGLVEGTLKEYVVDEKKQVWLWPRSSSPLHQAPVSYKKGRKHGDVEEVWISGVVVAATIRAPR